MNGCGRGTVVLLACAAVGLCGAQEMDVWSGRDRHVAVVNPVARPADDPDVLSLRGDWSFAKIPRTSPGRCFPATVKDWRPIRVPGCWESMGVGEQGVPSAHYCNDNSPKRMRHVYQGAGVYRRTVKIPASWSGKRIWIAAGGILAQGWIYLSDLPVPVGQMNTYCGTFKWEITDLVQPGAEATIYVVADNTVPFRGGAHYASGRYGGICRDIELQATPQTFIDNAWVHGNFDRQEAEVHVEVAGMRDEGRGISVRAEIDGETVETDLGNQTVRQSDNQAILKVALRDFRAWSPEHPNLYTARVDLVENGSVVQTRCERFGVRKLEVAERGFRLNGKPFFFRQCGDNHVYPATGFSPPDRDLHRRHLSVARAAGFNAIRLHTHNELPEYLEAADELGLLVQIELPYYGNYCEDPCDFDPIRDARERRTHFRRHPSYAVASGGNEGAFARPVARQIYAEQKREDPDRLVLQQDGGTHVTDPVFDPLQTDYFSGPLNVWDRGTFDPGAFVAHEYLNIAVKADSRTEGLYTGLWEAPVTRAGRAAFLAKFGLDHAWGDRLQDASHAFQKFYQKSGLESARMDPFCDGYCYWTICDTVVPREGTYTAQGLFDPWWQTKEKGASPDEFAVFNSPSAVLADFSGKKPYYIEGSVDFTGFYPKKPRWQNLTRVFAVGDVIPVAFMIAHYAEAEMNDATLTWELVADGKTLASGSKKVGTIHAGPVKSLDDVKLTVPAVAKPCKAVLRARVGDVGNAWDFWLFPRRVPQPVTDLAATDAIVAALGGRYPGIRRLADAPESAIVLAEEVSPEAERAAKQGRQLVTLANQTTPSNVTPGWWWIGKQVGTAVVRHPILGDFPYEPYLSPLLFRILKEGTPLPVAGVRADELVIAGEGFDSCCLYLSDSVTATGAHHVRISGIDVLSDTPEGAALLDAVLTYLRTMRGCRVPN